MIQTSKLFAHSESLGAFSPYYYKDHSGKFVFRESFEEIIAQYPEKLEIDISALQCVLSRKFILGDKTIVNGIYRSPWMGKPNSELNQWEFHHLPEHKEVIRSQEEIAATLFELLCEEVKDAVGPAKSVGILLSGGMDSRVVAGVLDQLIKDKKIPALKVVAYTWGNEDSRDVNYARAIAKRSGWDWKHYVVGPEKLWRNIVLAGKRGCEFSGLHLHAMPDIAVDAVEDVDIILAGSYGDSVGRAEFSGMHLTSLRPIDFSVRNFAHLISKSGQTKIKKSLRDEVSRYRRLFPRKHLYQKNELDYQLHYMRRMLNPCMEVIHGKVPLYQAFTSPKVFGYIWSMDASCRGDGLYEEILRGPLKHLADIPWARTGLKYPEKKGTPDGFTKRHHDYGHFLQNDLTGYIHETVQNLHTTAINQKQIQELFKLTRKYQGFNFDYLEALAVAVSFIIFSNTYDVLAGPNTHDNLISRIIDPAYLTGEYHLKQKLRQLQKVL
ncbi:asparagine synthase-related protein [Negadavirga shengliensis]|uniref:asparagine synthase (glutamine-hydrolyzing) n=1 Tax=Negadavirga shengliensis TaxID=1389218 RepID=A0ABV9SYS0_9BACT